MYMRTHACIHSPAYTRHICTCAYTRSVHIACSESRNHHAEGSCPERLSAVIEVLAPIEGSTCCHQETWSSGESWYMLREFTPVLPTFANPLGGHKRAQHYACSSLSPSQHLCGCAQVCGPVGDSHKQTLDNLQ